MRLILKCRHPARLYPIRPGKPSLRIDIEQLRADLATEVRQIVSKGFGCPKPPKPRRASQDLKVNQQKSFKPYISPKPYTPIP